MFFLNWLIQIMQKKMPVKEAVVFLQKATAALRPVFFPGRECCFSLGYSGAYLSGTSLFPFLREV